ncbi:MAG: hypothetical protein HS111_18105 [Kofleriaceae bacterium]|nr:hypothetical protein [Kofleriaceae bacterium]
MAVGRDGAAPPLAWCLTSSEISPAALPVGATRARSTPRWAGQAPGGGLARARVRPAVASMTA